MDYRTPSTSRRATILGKLSGSSRRGAAARRHPPHNPTALRAALAAQSGPDELSRHGATATEDVSAEPVLPVARVSRGWMIVALAAAAWLLLVMLGWSAWGLLQLAAG